MTSIYKETALKVVQGYNDWTIESIMSYRALNCTHQVLPVSLGREQLDNTSYRAYFSTMMAAFHNFNVTVKDIIVNEQEHKAVIWCSSTASSVIGPYSNEYMLLIYMTPDGTMVEKILEFVDSRLSVEFFPKLKAHFESGK